MHAVISISMHAFLPTIEGNTRWDLFQSSTARYRLLARSTCISYHKHNGVVPATIYSLVIVRIYHDLTIIFLNSIVKTISWYFHKWTKCVFKWLLLFFVCLFFVVVVVFVFCCVFLLLFFTKKSHAYINLRYNQRPIIVEGRYRSRLVIIYSWLDKHGYF